MPAAMADVRAPGRWTEDDDPVAIELELDCEAVWELKIGLEVPTDATLDDGTDVDELPAADEVDCELELVLVCGTPPGTDSTIEGEL